MPWTNSDGLVVFFSGESRSFDGGEYPGAGPYRTIEIEVPATSINSTASNSFGDPWVIIPRNSTIESVEVIAETACTSGGSPLLDIGLIRRDNTTEIDYDGLIVDMPLANINVNGEKNVVTAGVTYAGALVGTETAYPGYLVVSASAATYTAGRLVIRVNLYVKDEDLLNTNN